MRKLACEAQQLAERVQSQSLLARCEYWLGSSCAGTQDFSAAVDHLKRARWLGVPDGLRCEEKTDIHPLLTSVERHINHAGQNNSAEWSYQNYHLQQYDTPCTKEALLKSWTPQEKSYIKHGLKIPNFELEIRTTECATPSLTSESSNTSSSIDSIEGETSDVDLEGLKQVDTKEQDGELRVG
ncbi:hypothetical protein EKO04_007277 [Ascochyta lentis]|uniref:Uncharacterized protein n=1 Tax=Ascochyta lentis TaxID=205686 RepID=A0A8H7J180_9PLEO|nr:hypothetical protein EKO04_007277 [Ascochyta lentis]